MSTAPRLRRSPAMGAHTLSTLDFATGKLAPVLVAPELLKQLQPALQHLILPCCDSCLRSRGRLSRRDAYAVVLRAVVLQHFHAGPSDLVSAGHRERIDVAVSARRRPAD